MSDFISSRKACVAKISEVLEQEVFPHKEIHIKGVIEIVDQISDYYEEGFKLYPEVLIMSSRDMMYSYPGRFICRYTGELKERHFKEALK